MATTPNVMQDPGYFVRPTDDPRRAFQDERTRAIVWQNTMDRMMRGRQQYYQDREAWAGDQASQLYQELMSQPGYSPEEAQQIVQQEYFRNLNMTPDEFERRFQTDTEQAQIRGEPGRGFRPGQMADISAAGTARSRENLAFGRGESGDILGRARTRFGGIESAFGDESRAAIDPGKLRVSEAFPEAQRRAMESTEGLVRGAIDPAKLALSARFQQKFPMTDEEVQAITTMAGRDVGAQRQSAIDELVARANAAGTASPLGIAAARERLETSSAVDAPDAMTRARILARREQRTGEQTMESMRGEREFGIMGAKTGTELQMGSTRLIEQRAYEAMRIAAEQGLSDREIAAAGDRARLAAQNEMYQTSEGEAANKFYTGATQAAEQANVNRELGVEGRNQDVQMAIEQDQARRARDLALNRQQTEAGAQQERFGRGFATGQQTSGAAAAVANARLRGQQQARDFYGGREQWYGREGDVSQEDRLRTGQIGFGASGEAARGLAAWRSRPSWLNRTFGPGSAFGRGGAFGGSSVSGGGGGGPSWSVGGAQGAEGLVVKGPTDALVGEDGAEAILKLNKPGALRRIAAIAAGSFGPTRRFALDKRLMPPPISPGDPGYDVIDTPEGPQNPWSPKFNPKPGESFAGGGIVRGPTVMRLGEGGTDVVLPLTKPGALKRIAAIALNSERRFPLMRKMRYRNGIPVPASPLDESSRMRLPAYG